MLSTQSAHVEHRLEVGSEDVLETWTDTPVMMRCGTEMANAGCRAFAKEVGVGAQEMC